jgi:glutaredoxin
MKIKIYISDHCSFCREAIRYFQEKNIEVEQIDVTRNQTHFDEMMKHGGIATPFIVIGNQMIVKERYLKKMVRL